MIFFFSQFVSKELSFHDRDIFSPFNTKSDK